MTFNEQHPSKDSYTEVSEVIAMVVNRAPKLWFSTPTKQLVDLEVPGARDHMTERDRAILRALLQHELTVLDREAGGNA
jgi:hypothetical protein